MAYGTDVDEHDSGGALHILGDAEDSKKEG
jgi:hypothetical protein